MDIPLLQAQYRQTEQLYPTVMFTHTLLGVIVFFWTAFHFEGFGVSLAWFACLLVCLISRRSQIKNICRQLDNNRYSKAIHYRYIGCSAWLGSIWGVAALYVLHGDLQAFGTLVIIFSSGVAFGSIAFHVNFYPAFLMFFWSLLGPIAVYLLITTDMYAIVFVLTACACFYSFFFARRLFKFSLSLHKSTMEKVKLIDELSKANQRIQALSEIDPLTGLNNRSHFNSQVLDMWERAKLYKQNITFVLLDIDYFKPYNDNYGHVKGDTALQQVAEALLSVTPPSKGSLLARVGGEEFVAVIPNVTKEASVSYAENLREAVMRKEISHQHSPVSDNVTISLGVNVVKPSANTTLEMIDALDEADQALYEAKAAGRNIAKLRVVMSEHLAAALG